MHVTEIDYDEKTNTYAFHFDDGILLRVMLGDKWVYRQIELEYSKFNPSNLNYDLQPYFQYDTILTFKLFSVLTHTSKGITKNYYYNAMGYWYYILTNVMSFIRYYPSLGEWIDPFKPCYEKHELMDIKHRLRNLRKPQQFKWGHFDIIRNINEYNDYCKISRYARESILNFYSRFFKLSILNNNKHLRWILDSEDSFINYGFVFPMTSMATKCDAPKCKQYGCVLCDSSSTSFTNVTSDEADSWDFNGDATRDCDIQEPHPTDTLKWCKHLQFYYPKNKWNKRVGVRQKTSEMIKMQLTEEPFLWIGTAAYTLRSKYGERLNVKSRQMSAFNQMIEYVFEMHQYVDGELQRMKEGTIRIATAPGQITNRYELDKNKIDYLVNFLKINSSSLLSFIMNPTLYPDHIEGLFHIAKTHKECKSGKLTRMKDMLIQRKLLTT